LWKNSFVGSINLTSVPLRHRPITISKVLKQGDAFGIFGGDGDIRCFKQGSQGPYQGGTKLLSRFVSAINGEAPLLFSSTVAEKDVLLNVDLTIPDMTDAGQVATPLGA
jgi:hypothetical protein